MKLGMTKYSAISAPIGQELSAAAQESRIDALIRIMGVVVLIFGAALVYSTYANASALNIQEPALVPIYYVLGIILLASGLLASFAKFKG